jgi:predicted neutral ceramidase superfamily lipid hydrolase
VPSAIYLNWLAISAAVLSNVVIGFLWYGPLLGNAWMKEMGMAPDFKPDPVLLKRSMLLMIVSALLTAVVLAIAIELCRPSTWNVGDDAPHAMYGLLVAVAAWLGFYVPMLLGGVAWENRSWKLFGINAGYHLAALLAAGMILAHWP